MKRELMTIGLLLTASSTFAATRNWDGGGTGNDWSTAENWTADTLPGATDNAVFRGDEANTAATMTGSPTGVAQLWVGASNGAGDLATLTLNSATFSTTSFTRVGYQRTGISPTNGGNGRLVLNNSTYTSGGNIEVGLTDDAVASSGVIELNGTSTMSGRIFLARDAVGSGTLILNDTATFNGSGGSMNIGEAGTGVLTLNGGNFNSVADGINVGDADGSSGTINLFAGQLDAKSISVDDDLAGAGTAAFVFDQGTMIVDNNRNGLFQSWAEGTVGNVDVSVVASGGLLDDSALSAVYTTGAGSFDTGDGIIKWGFDGTHTAMWAVAVPEPSAYAMLAGLLGLTAALIRRRK